MPELAVFSAITAEEEAATSVLYALKKLKYEGHERINFRDHVHKAGLYPFIRLLGEAFLPPDAGLQVTLYFGPHFKKDREILRIRMPIGQDAGRQICLVPEPPLGFISTGPDGKEKNYHKEVGKIATAHGIKSIFEYIKSLANERNKMLYASPSSIPDVKDSKVRLEKHTDAALLNLIMYLLIEPHGKQSLVQEALITYLRILGRFSAD